MSTGEHHTVYPGDRLMPKARLGSGLRMQHLVQHARSETPAVKVANALRRFAVAKAKTLAPEPKRGQ